MTHNIVFLECNSVTSSRYRFDLNELRYLGRPNAVLRSAILDVKQYPGDRDPVFFAKFYGQRTLFNGKVDGRRQKREMLVGVDTPDGAFLAAFVGQAKCFGAANQNLENTLRAWSLTAKRMRERLAIVFPDLVDDPYTKLLLSRYAASEGPSAAKN